jgi:hypothetical protein
MGRLLHKIERSYDFIRHPKTVFAIGILMLGGSLIELSTREQYPTPPKVYSASDLLEATIQGTVNVLEFIAKHQRDENNSQLEEEANNQPKPKDQIEGPEIKIYPTRDFED